MPIIKNRVILTDNDLSDSIFVDFTYINILTYTVILRKYYKCSLDYYIRETVIFLLFDSIN